MRREAQTRSADKVIRGAMSLLLFCRRVACPTASKPAFHVPAISLMARDFVDSILTVAIQRERRRPGASECLRIFHGHCVVNRVRVRESQSFDDAKRRGLPNGEATGRSYDA